MRAFEEPAEMSRRFSPSQWVLGCNPRGPAGALDEDSWAELCALKAQQDPQSVFVFQHQARMQARKALLYLGCSS